jgi:hypothetical protein
MQKCSSLTYCLQTEKENAICKSNLTSSGNSYDHHPKEFDTCQNGEVMIGRVEPISLLFLA